MSTDLVFTTPRYIYHIVEEKLWRGYEATYLPPTHDAGTVHG
jgi:hypothetical protein